MHASRNTALCTKDCVCLFICPTGATDTETGQIDASACLDGCRLCVDACPSHAISLVADCYPEPKPKAEPVVQTLTALLESKARQEALAQELASAAESKTARLIFAALAVSNRILAEDCAREAGFMLPQSRASKQWLASLANGGSKDLFSEADLKELLSLL